MDRPDLTRRQLVERFHFTDASGADDSFCGLEWQPLPDGRLLVVAYEHPDNPGQSVTDAAEYVYQQFVDQAGIDPGQVVWVESYPAEGKDEQTFDLCSFVRQADGTLESDWVSMVAGDWQQLGVEPPAAPTFTRVKPHPEAAGDEPPLPDNIGDYHPPARPAGPRGEVVYRGERVFDETAGAQKVQVTVCDAHGMRPLHPRLDLRRHSPMGFDWGYPGSGPAQLALALLADLTDDETAEQHYKAFKAGVVAHLPDEAWEMSEAEMRAILVQLRQQPPPTPGHP